MKNRMITNGLILSALCIAVSVPGVGWTDPKPFSCSPVSTTEGGVCVKALLNELDIICSTNSEGRPQCWATAKAGAAAKEIGAGGVPPAPCAGALGCDYYLFEYEVSTAAIRHTKIQGSGRFRFPGRVAFGASYWPGGSVPEDGTVVTRTEEVRTPVMFGPAGGCLTFSGSFSVTTYARQGLISAPVIAASSHYHGIGPRKYCAEDTR
jgi:hypothetical protein